ncbi:thiol oxidoreductase [Singapore grouper iridovirus]|uniref:Sulfhydryl oxidase n=2 Tax=Singapore grouper iridovirus TaxID=262968 RepID=Q5GAH9_9VIRU|nr:thiol oxidoreductase [Singapore grouper iridovirus]AAS18085.1 thiol oxidoreductase [Singapore grouper iridovirus]AAV91064.1 thiol oxidoreductase [Grouper iridovirus]WAU86779.1 thiol oxidoreductase [Singapore grouper iridovirus]WRW24637.1 thiol oxidoreductase [Singapore grouper iridovirus]
MCLSIKMQRRYSVESKLSVKNASLLEGGGFGPHGFGPAMWFTFHTGAAAQACKGGSLTASEHEAWEHFIRSMWVCIPCQTCSVHFKNMLRDIDFTLVCTGIDVFKLSVDMHNRVNTRLNKPCMSLEKAKRLYGLDTKTGPPVVVSYRARLFQ